MDWTKEVRNKQFISELYSASKDVKPGLFSDKMDKILFATIYFGWLVSTYRELWEENL